jgi:putative inorganic carbon (HCO3(-)) transporter
VAAPRRFPQIYLPLIGIGVAALWPLTAYALNPLLLPAAAVLVAAGVVVLKKPEYGVAIVLAMIPFIGAQLPQPAGVGLALPGAPLRALVPLMVFALLGYGLMVRGQDRRPLPAVFAGISLMLIAAIVSAFRAIEPDKSIPDVFLLVTAAALFLAIVNVCRTRQQLMVMLGGALAGLLAASLQGVLQQIFGIYSTLGFVANGEVLDRIQGSFGHPNSYAGYLTLLMPLAAVVGLSREFPRWLRLLGGAAAVVAVPALIYSYSRGALAAMIAGVIVWLALTRPRTALLVGVGVAIVLVVATPSTIRERFSNTTSNDVSLRTDVANSALDLYGKQPLFGSGIGNFQAAYEQLNFSQNPEQRRLFHTQQLLVPTAAPSQYLNTLSEQGLFGLVALGLFTLQTVILTFRVSRSRDPIVRALGLGIGMAIAGAIIYSALEVTLQEDQALALFGLVAIASVAIPALTSDQEEPGRVASRHMASAVLAQSGS